MIEEQIRYIKKKHKLFPYDVVDPVGYFKDGKYHESSSGKTKALKYTDFKDKAIEAFNKFSDKLFNKDSYIYKPRVK